MTGRSRFAARQFLVIVADPLGRVRVSVENALSAARNREERDCDEDRDGKRGTKKRGRERWGTVAGRSTEAANLPELNPRIFFARRTATLARHLGLVPRGTWSGQVPEPDSMPVYEIQTTL